MSKKVLMERPLSTILPLLDRRAQNVINRAKPAIFTIGDLCKLSKVELTRVPGAGKGTVNAIDSLLKKMGLWLGMTDDAVAAAKHGTKRICPLLKSAVKADHELMPCIETACAWYNPVSFNCAVLALSVQLTKKELS